MDSEVEWEMTSERGATGEESEDLVNSGDNFSSGKDSDSEGGEQDIVFNPREKYVPPFEIDMLFSTKDEVRCVVNNHAVKTRRSLKIPKNDCRRMYVRCTVTKSQAYRAKRKELKVIEGAENRFCVRHLHENFKKAGFRGLAFKLALWNAAKATTLPEYELRMKEMALLDESAVEWFNDKPPLQWSMSYFQTFPKCDMLLNNLCESFNSSILEAREKPILTMLEWIREYLMTRLTENRDKAKKRWCEKQICPRIRKIIEKNMEKSVDCIPLKSDDWNYEIKVCDGDRLTSVTTYLAIYIHAISPVNGPKLWGKTGYIPPMPPNFGRKRGRPARARRLGADEPRDKGRGGHNQIRSKRREADIAAGLTRDFAAPINTNVENASGNDVEPSKRTKVPPQIGSQKNSKST
ncbi:hypothetical protein BUALT_Bualt09G0028700 [Buddleja alternifolia]|uniref:Uncharacterized protein n=1 Tax=Buddleja alternifolia TaxID=168488 RepID=A0AAV6X179_9LAMI|nr:hypothetical protein BUALT_Bualt09G0028700 [Buddleja alternifolia]